MALPLLLFMFSNSAFCTNKNVIIATNGVLDLSGYSFESSGVVQLDGQWEVYWQSLLFPGDFTNKNLTPTGYVNVPAPWNGQKAGDTVLPDYGYGTFRLKIILPPGKHILGIRVQSIPTIYRLWVNNLLVATNGIFGTNEAMSKPYWSPHNAYFNSESTNLTILIQIANFIHNRSGIEYSAFLGTASQIAAERERVAGMDLFLFGILLIMGFYHLGIFALRRSDLSPVFFALFCLIIAMRTLFTGEKLFFEYFPTVDWEFAAKLEYLSMPFAVAAFMAFLNNLYQKVSNKILDYIFYGLAAAYSLIVIFSPEKFYSVHLTIYHIIMLVNSLYILVVLAISIIQKREGSIIISLGFLMVLLTTINDILYVNGIVKTGYMVSFGVFFFILSQSFILSMRFSRAFRKVEVISMELERSNLLLEQRVGERTAELAEEKNRLKLRNEKMENDLEMARKIQLALIPLQTPGPDIACYYKPMEKVGGDFYDFVHFADDHIVGIFISDVSGHGVPAAFITSMMKSLMLQIAPEIDNPAEFLQYLNTSLNARTDGNFITAFYGIFNRETREFVFSNAGHNPPILILSDSEDFLRIERNGIPLAVLDNDELRTISKGYFNQKIILPLGSKLLLYTDGLVETVNEVDKTLDPATPDFETKVIRKAIKELRGLDCGEFVEQMSVRLKEFHGNEDYEDDVCMICVDVN